MKILVGAIPGPEGEAALTAAVQEATLREATLIVVDYVRVAQSETAGSRYQRGSELLDRRRAELDAAGVEVIRLRPIGVSTASSELLRIAGEQAVDLIVIGIRRRSRVGKLVLGSNAQDILLRAPCPVLAVKGDSDELEPAPST